MFNSKKKFFRKLRREAHWYGSGTQNDPLVIKSTKSFLNKLWIIKNREYILFKNSTLDVVVLRNCQNISFRNCIFNSLRIYDCSKLKIFDSNFSDFYMAHSYDNLVENSNILNIININSKGNTFINTVIPLNKIMGLRRGSVPFFNQLIWTFFFITIGGFLIGIGALYKNLFLTGNYFLFISLIILFLIFLISSGFFLLRIIFKIVKLRKFGPNELKN